MKCKRILVYGIISLFVFALGVLGVRVDVDKDKLLEQPSISLRTFSRDSSGHESPEIMSDSSFTSIEEIVEENENSSSTVTAVPTPTPVPELPACKRKTSKMTETDEVPEPHPGTKVGDKVEGEGGTDVEESHYNLNNPNLPLNPLVPAKITNGKSGPGGRKFLVATLDGKVTLLDQSGQELWFIQTGELFSSTISSLQLSENGKWINLIPSLTGGLYKYDKESLLPMPMNVDSLLQKSFKLSNDVVITGGKELRTFGIDLKTGKLRYDCGISGCTSPKLAELEEAIPKEGPITLVVKKQLQTVRAIDSMSGTEKWNFSVGTHELGLAGLTEGCYEEEQKEGGTLNYVKVVIPEGRLLSADPDSHTVWDKKFESPIAQAWVLENERLIYVDPTQNTPLKEGPLALYVGKHNHQFYVQESQAVSAKLDELLSYPRRGVADADKPLQIGWKPSFQVNEDSDSDSTTALTHLTTVRPSFGPFYVLEKDQIISPSEVEQLDTTTSTPPPVTMYPEEGEDGPDAGVEEDVYDPFNFDGDEGPIEIINQVIVGSLWYWWKEVLGISLLTAVILNILLMKPIMRAVRIQTIRDMLRYFQHWGNRNQIEGVVPVDNQNQNQLVEYHPPNFNNELGIPIPRPRTISDSFSSQCQSPFVEFPEQEILYMSQYLREFEPVQCLGKGGFGVVFEAKKKIDDRNYAVKRIALPDREEARFRVMREVKALAQLDHRNIVRYFNAWIENPPNGWLEKNDPLWAKCHIGSMTPTVEHACSDFPSEINSSSAVEHGGRQRKTTLQSADNDLEDSRNPLAEEDSFIIFDEDFEPTNMESIGGFGNSNQWKSGHIATTINLSDSSSISEKGFWKKPTNNTVSWEISNSERVPLVPKDRDDLLLSFNKSRLVFESEVFEKNNSEDVELGEEAYEKESFSIMYLYIQQELCQKRTLRDWLRSENERSLQTVVKFFGQIVDAVEYVHSKKLIHRDLKPSNIFLAGNLDTEEPVLKIGDFGLATTALADVGSGVKNTVEEKKADNNLTSQVGTQLYMSPEQFKRKPYDYKVDIYSLGLIFFELLVPFHTEMERHDVLSQMRKLKIPSYFEDSFPEENSLIVTMISHSPNSRPDATSISQWVKSHLRSVEILSGSGDGDHDVVKEHMTHRSNSSPGHLSISRLGDKISSDSSNTKNSKISLQLGKSERNRFHKSHSTTTM